MKVIIEPSLGYTHRLIYIAAALQLKKIQLSVKNVYCEHITVLDSIV